MKPISLKIEGLNSFSEMQTIDFTKLTEKRLFGIFGPTGSGKTTILDGITLALYGSISRGSSEFINSNKKSAYVKYVFQIGLGEKRKEYSVERTFKKKKNSDKAQHYKSILIEMDRDDKVLADKKTEVDEEIIKILGLTKDDFTRSVVIPQGKFSEFLKLKNKEKRKMLERIFNLEKFGLKLTDEVNKHKSRNIREIEKINASLEQYKNVSSEKIEENIRLTDKLNKEKEEIGHKLAYVQNEKNQIQKIKSELDELIEIRINLEELKLQEKKLMEQKDIDKSKQSEIEIIYEKNKEEVNSYELKLNQLFISSEYRKIVFESYNSEKQVKELIEKYKIIKSKNNNCKNNILKNYQKITDIEKALIEKNEELKNIVNNIKDIEDKTEDNNYFISLMEKINNKEKEFNDIKQIKKEKTDIGEKFKILSKNINEIVIVIDKLKKQYKLKIEEFNKKNNEYEKNKLENISTLIASKLEKGKPCPVCGSIEHPGIANILQEKNYQKLISETEKDVKNIDKELNKIQIELIEKKQLKSQLDTQANELINKEKLLEDNETVDIEKIKEELTILKSSFKTKKEESDILRRTHKELKIKKENLSLNINNLSLEKAKLEKGIEYYQKSQLENNIELEEIKKLVKYHNDILEKNKQSNNIDNFYQEYKRINSNDKFMEQIQKKKKETELKIEDNNIQKNKLIEKLSKLAQKEAVIKVKIKSLDTNKQSLMNDIQNMYKIIEQEKSIKTSEKELYDITIKKENKIIDKIDDLMKNKEFCNMKIGSLAKEIKILENGLIKIYELTKTKNEIEKELDIVNKIQNLIKGGSFVEFAAQKYLKYISYEASKRLKNITNERYALEIDEESSFIIRDDFNGGMRRECSTLSGGETFLVSLALALSLSSHVQLKGKIPLEFFFLDEGFGTLDDNILELVIESLEKLNEEKLTVGVISHLSKLKDRMPVKLLVEPAQTGISGTKVRIDY